MGRRTNVFLIAFFSLVCFATASSWNTELDSCINLAPYLKWLLITTYYKNIVLPIARVETALAWEIISRVGVRHSSGLCSQPRASV
jgi:hypothetical protein